VIIYLRIHFDFLICQLGEDYDPYNVFIISQIIPSYILLKILQAQIKGEFHFQKGCHRSDSRRTFQESKRTSRPTFEY